MNRLNLTHIRAMMWKEFVEGMRTSWFFIPLTIAFVVGMQYLPVAQILNNKEILPLQKGMFLAMIAIYLPVMTIPFFGNVILFRSLYEERRQKSIHVLFASGVSPLSVWTGKVFLVTLLSYLISVITFVVFWLSVKLYTGFSLVMTVRLWLLIMLVMPMASIGILSLAAWSYWAFRNAAQLVGLLMPILTSLGIWNFSIYFGTSLSTSLVGLFSLIIGLVFIGGSMLGVKCLSKEHIAF
ncbi:MAG: ABC transporter permease [Firmicutes bacterium]|nr:ABC transporter permease [Bacillota bacterium]